MVLAHKRPLGIPRLRRPGFALAFALTVLVALVALLAPTGATAEEPMPTGWAYDLSRDTMSPFCPGRSLSDCPSPQAESLRMWILVQEAAGRSRADVEAELVERYGDAVRGAPRAEGFGLAAYVIPVAAFAVGGGVLVVFLRRRTRAGAEPTTAAAPALDPELARIVDSELESRSG